MEVPYFDLISPSSLFIPDVGHIRTTKLSDIDKLPKKYDTYRAYVQLLSFTPKIYYKYVEPDKFKAYDALSIEEKANVKMFDILIENQEFRDGIVTALNFFFDESVAYDEDKKIFVVFLSDKNDEINIVGTINGDIYDQVIDIIAQRHGLLRGKSIKKKNIPKFKNEKARKLWEQQQNDIEKDNEAKAKVNEKNLDFANIVASIASHSASLNMINIWDMTVFNIYDQFQRMRVDKIYDINSRSVSVWGDKENKFDIDLWYKNIHDNIDDE